MAAARREILTFDHPRAPGSSPSIRPIGPLYPKDHRRIRRRPRSRTSRRRCAFAILLESRRSTVYSPRSRYAPTDGSCRDCVRPPRRDDSPDDRAWKGKVTGRMGVRKVITMCHFNRPDYSRQVIEALRLRGDRRLSDPAARGAGRRGRARPRGGDRLRGVHPDLQRRAVRRRPEYRAGAGRRVPPRRVRDPPRGRHRLRGRRIEIFRMVPGTVRRRSVGVLGHGIQPERGASPARRLASRRPSATGSTRGRAAPGRTAGRRSAAGSTRPREDGTDSSPGPSVPGTDRGGSSRCIPNCLGRSTSGSCPPSTPTRPNGTGSTTTCRIGPGTKMFPPGSSTSGHRFPGGVTGRRRRNGRRVWGRRPGWPARSCSTRRCAGRGWGSYARPRASPAWPRPR